MRLRKFLSPLVAVLFCLPLLASADALRDGHPERYVVQKGDTLWDISSRFLHQPWLWPEIWHHNQDIQNPHLIYPGDVISLVYIDGQPRLTVQTQDRVGAVVHLSPRVREESISSAIPTIPLGAIRPFLTETGVLDGRTLANAPYIVAGSDDRVLGSRTDVVYVRGLSRDAAPGGYSVVRQGDAFHDPDSRRVLGYAAVHLGDAVLEREGDPATMSIVRSNREILPGDRVLVGSGQQFPSNFYPKPPEGEVEGRIISVLDGVNQIGQYSVVVINRGSRHGLEVGNVLAIYKAGRTVRDTFGPRRGRVTLPDEHAGELIVFRTFDELSFALVMKATRAMHTLDAVRNP
jgi:hypothetical protein